MGWKAVSRTAGEEGSEVYSCVMGDTSLLKVCVKFLSLWSFQAVYRGPLPPVASVPLFNPAQVAQVRAFL